MNIFWAPATVRGDRNREEGLERLRELFLGQRHAPLREYLADFFLVEVAAPIHVDLLEDLLALGPLPGRDLGVGAARLLRTAIRNGRREA